MRTWIGSRPEAPAWILCPAPSLPAPQRLTFCLLARVADGTVWLFELEHAFFAATTVEKFLAAFAQALVHTREPEVLGTRLRAAFGVALAVVADPPLDRIEASRWHTRRLAMALTLVQTSHRERGPSAQAARRMVAAWQARIHCGLDVALARFVGALDESACRLAGPGPLEARLYNYLAVPAHRRNRTQFAAAFPVLVRAAASGRGFSEGAALRVLVDQGAPLTKALASRWRVSPGAIRALQACPARAGAPWEARPWYLARVLDAIRADDRPGDAPEAWDELNHATDLARRMFGMRPWLSPVALAWIRHNARGRWLARRAVDPLIGPTQTRELPAPLAEAMARVLMREARGTQARDEGALLEALARAVVFRLLLRMTPGRRQEVARVFDQLHQLGPERMRAAFGAENAAPLPRLLDEEFVAANGARVIRNLDTPHAIRAAGTALQNCLARETLHGYLNGCSLGTTFLVGIFEPGALAPTSVAQFRLRGPDQPQKSLIALVQHRARGNAAPDELCRAAVRELGARLEQGLPERGVLDNARPVVHCRRPAQVADDRVLYRFVRPAVIHAMTPPLFLEMVSELTRLQVDPTWNVARAH